MINNVDKISVNYYNFVEIKSCEPFGSCENDEDNFVDITGIA